jgi:integral membrane sensor domain MASE1
MADSQDVRGHVTTESTKKSLKLQKVIGVLVLVVGICLTFFSETQAYTSAGMFTSCISMIWIAIVNFRIWWEHG